MKKTALMIVLGILIVLNPVMAQSDSLSIDCASSKESNSLQPGGEENCNVQFPSSFNWNNYTYDWSITEGEILQKSVESVSFQVPENTSASEIILELKILDASGENYTAETFVQLETKNDSQDKENNTNQTYEPPVEEEPEENSSNEEPVISDFKLTCADSVEAGSAINCSVMQSDYSTSEDHEWDVEGIGEVKGNQKTGIYTAPKTVDQVEEAEIILTKFSSSKKMSDSEVVNVTPLETNQDSDRNSQEIHRYQEKIREQRETIENQKKTIKDLRETVENQRQRIREMEDTNKQTENTTEKNESSSEARNSSESSKNRSSEKTRNSKDSVLNQNSSQKSGIQNDSAQLNKTEENAGQKQNQSLLEAFTSLFS